MGIFNRDNNQKIIDHEILPMHEQQQKRLYLVDYENVSDSGLVGVDTLTENDTVIIFYGSLVKSVAYDSLIAITSSKANIEHMKAEKTAKNYLDFQLTTYLGYKLGKSFYDQIFIISKDAGFDAVVDFWNTKNYTITRQISIVVKEESTHDTPVEPSETVPKADKPKRQYTRKPTNTNRSRSNSRTSSRPKIVTNSSKPPKTTKSRPTVAEKKRAELRTALKGANLNAPDYKKVYEAFAISDTTSAYNNNLQKSLGNDKTSVIYKATSKIFENSKK